MEQQTCVVGVVEADLLPHEGPEQLVPQAQAEAGEGQREHAPAHPDGQRADQRDSLETGHTDRWSLEGSGFKSRTQRTGW